MNGRGFWKSLSWVRSIEWNCMKGVWMEDCAWGAIEAGEILGQDGSTSTEEA